MMETAQEQISPEEKLLKVIQGDGEEEQKKPAPEEKMLEAVKGGGGSVKRSSFAKATADREAGREGKTSNVQRPTSNVKVGDGAKEEKGGKEKPKLKLVKAESAQEAPDSETPAEETLEESATEAPAPASAGVIAAGPVVSGKKGPGGRFGIGTVNKCLAAVALIMIGLAAFEVASFSMESRLGADEVSGFGFQVSGKSEEVIEERDQEVGYSFAKVQDDWKKRDILGNPKLIPVPPGPRTLKGWQEYVRKNLKLIGFTGGPEKKSEAIIVDNKENRMFIARSGQRIIVGEQDLELEQIQNDRVVLTDGKEKVMVK